MKSLILSLFVSIATIGQSQTLSQSLVGYYKLNNSFNDESLTNITGVGFNVTDDIGIETTANTSKNFNGTNSYIDLSNNTRGITNEITVSAWVKSTDTKRQFVVSNYNSLTDERGYFLALDNGFALIGGREGTACSFTQCISTTQINDGFWHYIAGTIKDNTWQIFVDCNLENSETTSCSSFNLASNDPTHIGRWHEAPTGEHRYFNGSIDEVLIYNRELASSEIIELCELGYLSTKEESLGQPEMSVYPNPTSNYFQVQFSDEKLQDFQFTLLDIQGRQVLDGTSNGVINMETITAGTYVLIIDVPGLGRIQQKVIKTDS